MTDRSAADNQQSNDQRAPQAAEQKPQVDSATAAATRALVLPGAVSELPGSIRRRPASILTLQRSVGNAAVVRLLRETERDIQRDDEEEYEAEDESEPVEEEDEAPVAEESAADEPESEATEEPAYEEESSAGEESSDDGGGAGEDETAAYEEPVEETEETGESVGDTLEEEDTDDGLSGGAAGEVIDDEGTDETDSEEGEVVDDEGTEETTDSEGGETIDDEGTDAEEDDGPSLSLPFSLDTLIVDDDETAEEGQLTKSAFIGQVRSSAVPQAKEILSGAGSDVDVDEGVGFWFDKISGLSGPNLQRGLNLFAPGTKNVETAAEMVPIVVGRLLGPVRVYATTGEIVGLPDIPGLGTPLFDPGVLFKAAGDAAPSMTDPLAIRGKLGPGEPMGQIGSEMAAAFGHNFDDVRIHRDSVAATLASGFDARAFTVGSHIAFAQGEHQPGTLAGDALLAHELAHVAQQKQGAAAGVQTRGAGDENDLEADADRAAVGVVSALRGGRAGLGAWARTLGPNLRSGLRLQRCKSKDARPVMINADVVKAQNELQTLLSDPTNGHAAATNKISELGDNAGHVLFGIPLVRDTKRIREIAGNPAGPDLLKAIAQALRNGDYQKYASQVDPTGRDSENKLERDEARLTANTIDSILKNFDDPPPEGTADEKADLVRVNAAVDADPRKAEYAKAGLRFPVVLHQSGVEREGGVYYTQQLSVAAREGSHPIQGKTSGISHTPGNVRPVLIYIEIGGKALRDEQKTEMSVGFTQSALRHEFEHYQQYSAMKDPANDADGRVTELKGEFNSEGASSADVEAVSAQLTEDIAKMTDGEVKSLINYLADNWNGSTDLFRNAAIARMKNPKSPLGAPDGVQMKRLLKLITGMGLQKAEKRKPSRDLVTLVQGLS